MAVQKRPKDSLARCQTAEKDAVTVPTTDDTNSPGETGVVTYTRCRC